MYELLQRCNDGPWITKKISDTPINDFIFDTVGSCNIQINITRKSVNTAQRIWVGSFVIKPTDIPLSISNREIYIKLSRLLDSVALPKYKDIYIEEHQGKKFKAEQYKIQISDKLDFSIRDEAEVAYKKEVIDYLLSNRPIIYKDNYDVKVNRPFHPYQWANNLLILCNYNKSTLALIRRFNEGQSFIWEQSNALYYLYPYSLDVYGVTIKKGWTTGLSQGYILSALMCIYKRTQDKRYRENADRIFNSFMRIQKYHNTKPNTLWITNIDKNQFLWFQLVPQSGVKQFDILNGQIAALAGLYSYYRVTKSPEALLLIRAGITTVKHYLINFRRPGKTLEYFYILKMLMIIIQHAQLGS